MLPQEAVCNHISLPVPAVRSQGWRDTEPLYCAYREREEGEKASSPVCMLEPCMAMTPLVVVEVFLHAISVAWYFCVLRGCSVVFAGVTPSTLASTAGVFDTRLGNCILSRFPRSRR